MSYYRVAGCYFSWGIGAFVSFFLFGLFLLGVGGQLVGVRLVHSGEKNGQFDSSGKLN